MGNEWKYEPCDRAMTYGYTLWVRQGELGPVYQLTKDGLPPPEGHGGYYKLEPLLILKGL